MFNVFTEGEKEVANLLVKKGLEKASASLATIFNGRVTVDGLDFTLLSILKEVNAIRLGETKNFHVLKNKLIGDLKGASILIINQFDVSKIAAVCIPEGADMGEGICPRTMTIEILKEIDNIISASVSGEFANEMDISLRGDVPEHYELNPDQLTSFVTDQFSRTDFVINFKAHLRVLELDMSPEFIWVLDKEFVR